MLNLEKSAGSQKSAQFLDLPGDMKKVLSLQPLQGFTALMPNKVTAHFFITPFKSMIYMSFSRPTDLFRLKVVTLWAVILLSLFAQNAYSSDINGRYWIYGVGRQACSTYMEARNEGGFSEISYKNWISGYLTSSNQSSEETYNLLGGTDFKRALVWIDSYCHKYPENTIYMAMANMTAVHYATRRKSK